MIRRRNPLSAFHHAARCAAAGLLTTLAALCASQLAAQNNPDAARPAAQSVNYRERPRYPYDSQRLRRRPLLDGIIGDNEWDALYTIGDGPVKGTLYCNWDNDYLYLAAKTDQPAWVVFDVDASADGWLRGADNLELAIPPVAGDSPPQITARLLDAAGNRDAPVWNERVVDPKSIQVVEKGSGGGQVVEMAIPRGIAGLLPRANATISLRGDLLPAGPPPIATPPYEPHLLVDVTLVESRVVAAEGVTPRLALEDNRVIPGQTVKATLELTNQTNEPVRVRAVNWSGEGGAADLLKSLRDPNVPPLEPQKTLKTRYSAALPDTAVPGFYQITASAQLDNGKTVLTTASFSVVEPFTLQILSDTDPVKVNGPTRLKVNVEIASAAPGSVRGDVEIEAPAGWEVQGRTRKTFVVEREDTSIRAPFYMTIPSTTPTGDYVLSASVSWRKKVWKTRRTLHVVGGPETAAPTTPPKTQEKP